MSKSSLKNSKSAPPEGLETHGAEQRRGASRLRSTFETPTLFLACLLGLIIALGLWSARAQVDQVVRVEGRIIPAGRSQQIQHLEGGIIASINVKEGAAVKQGDLLLTIDGTTAGANLSETTAKLNSQRLRAARLEASAQSSTTLDLPDDLAKLPEAAAERNLFSAQYGKLAQEIIVHENLMRQHTAAINEAKQKQTRLSTELATARQRSAMMNNMAERGAASKLEVLDALSREQRLKTEIAEAEGSIPKLKAALAEEQARIDTARAEFRSQAQNELVTALAESERLRQIMTAATDRVKRTDIRAPNDGVINRIAVNTVGGVVKPGESLIELIPNNHEIYIEAKANPRDRGTLRPGLNAEIRVSAYDTGELGVLKGHVTEVSADSIKDGRDDPYFLVNVLVNTLPPLYANRAMVPGMTVTADIVTGQRTILGYLLSPLRKFTYNMFRDPR